MRWEPDRGLWVRMALALTLVFAIPFAFAYRFLFLLNTVGLSLLEMLTKDPWNGRFHVEFPVLAAAVGLGFAAQYAVGERVALRSNGARRVTEEEYPDVHGTVDRLASQLEIPRPRVAISRSDAPNAFTVGRTPSSGTVVLTTGLLERLSVRSVADGEVVWPQYVERPARPDARRGVPVRFRYPLRVRRSLG